MTDNPDQIRANIEATRRELGSDVDALADKVTPSKIVHRQTDKVKSGFASVKERVMGAAHDVKGAAHGVKDSAAGGVGSLGESISGAPQQAVEKAKGNPLAVGLIAFGAGWLISSLIPASSAEKQAGSAIKEKAQPLVHEAQDAAKQVAQNLKEPAQDAAAALKERATDAADAVKSEGQSAAQDLKGSAQDARDTVQEQRTQ